MQQMSINECEWDNGLVNVWPLLSERIVVAGWKNVPPRMQDDILVNRRSLHNDIELSKTLLRDGACGLDEFDNNSALYIIVTDRYDGRYLGSARLIPTVVSTILNDTARELISFPHVTRGPRIWEMSRVCSATNRRVCEARKPSVDVVLGELLATVVEVAAYSGVKQLVYMTGDGMLDALERIGWPPRLIARPAICPEIAPHVVFLEVGEIPLLRIKATTRANIGVRAS